MAGLRQGRFIARGDSYCIFSRGGRELAVSVAGSTQVAAGGPTRAVAGAPASLVGLVEVEGRVLPVQNLDSLLGLPERSYEIGSQILVLRCGDFEAGVLVDRVKEVIKISDNELQPPSESDVPGPLVRACWHSESRRVLILDADRFVSEILAFREAMPEWGPVVREDRPERMRAVGTEQLCIFSRGHRQLAMSTAAAREMLSGEVITCVPQAPPELVGVLNLRGDLLPVIRIDRWLGLPQRDAALSDQIVVVEAPEVLLGLLVDRVYDVRTIECKEISGYTGGGETDVMFRGTWDGPTGTVTLLDTERLLDAAVTAISSGFAQALGTRGAGVELGAGSTQ